MKEREEPLICCSHAEFGYENQTVIRDVSFTVEKGDYLAVIGENGAGKSTLVKGILGLLRPIRGEVRFAGGIEQSAVGYLPQQSAAVRDFPATVEEVVLSGCLKRKGWRPFYSAAEKRLSEENMERMKIRELKKKCFRELSGGQQQRVLIARALCATRELLVLDEPAIGLDPMAAEEMYELISRLNREEKTAIIMVSHDIRNVMKYAGRILQVSHGVQFFGTLEEYRSNQASELFLGGGGHA